MTSVLGSTYGFFGGESGSAEGNARVLTVTMRPASIVAAFALSASLAVAACGGQSPGTVLSAVSCAVPRLNAVSSATATPAAKSLGIVNG